MLQEKIEHSIKLLKTYQDVAFSLSIDDWKHLHDIKEKQIKMF